MSFLDPYPSTLTPRRSPSSSTVRFRNSQLSISAVAASPLSLKQQTTHSMPPEKMAVFESLEDWATHHVLPLLKPVEQCWQPASFLPDPTQNKADFHDQVRALRERTAQLPDDYFVVLVGDMITEDDLPTYQTIINTLDGVRTRLGRSPTPGQCGLGPGPRKKNRHGDLLRTYLYLSGRVDMLMIERTIQYLIGAGMEPRKQRNNPDLGSVNRHFQNEPTFDPMATGSLAKQAGDPVLAAHIRGPSASYETTRERYPLRIVEELLEVDPTGPMMAISSMMEKKITMPAHLMYDGKEPRLFEHFSAVAQRLGVYAADDYADILEFLVGRWGLEKLEGLTGEGRRARDFVCGLAPRIRKLQERADERAKKMEPHYAKFSWIFNKEVLL
uniref:Acyl-[acyl-carrier-protein] desaturase n=1 Tax=Carica papaya TaxID=3649 RepID=Q6SRZ5_CARPA|nr:stearoyl acyl desaturase [Carica papaya]